IPEPVATICLDPLHAGLASAPALHHALDRFQPVEVVAIHPAVTDAEGFADARAERHLDLRCAPRDGQARTRPERELQLARRVVHSARPLPVPREVLIVEERRTASAGAEDFNDLLEKLVSRVFRLALLVARILTVLAYQHDSIDCELSAAERQGLGDRWVN